MSVGGEAVASARLGENERGAARSLELGPQPPDVDAHVLGLRLIPPPPYPAQQMGAGQQLAAVQRQLAEQGEFARREVHLLAVEFALLRELALNRGKLLSRTHLLRRVWGRGYETETEYVRVYIRRLRAKLERPGSPPLILTQPRAGYRLAAD